MLSFFISTFAFFIAISVLIIFHEYGHFIVARWFNVKVIRFSIGFGKKLWSRVSKQGTEVCIASIPLGGYVKFVDEEEGEIDRKDKPYAFNTKPLYVRTLIVLAGPGFNFILAWLLYFIMFILGVTAIKPVIGFIHPNSLASHAGLKVGDVIQSVDNNNVQSWRDFRYALFQRLHDESVTPIQVDRKGDLYTLELSLKKLGSNENLQDYYESIGIEPYLPMAGTIFDKILSGSIAKNIGLESGDELVAVNAIRIKNWWEFRLAIKHAQGDFLFTIKTQF